MPPRVGRKIDYDIDGKLVGNWFRHGSGAMPATSSAARLLGWPSRGGLRRNDPSQIVVSFVTTRASRSSSPWSVFARPSVS